MWQLEVKDLLCVHNHEACTWPWRVRSQIGILLNIPAMEKSQGHLCANFYSETVTFLFPLLVLCYSVIVVYCYFCLVLKGGHLATNFLL